VFSLTFVKEFKMKKEYALLQSKVTMEENLKIRIFNYSIRKMVFFTTFQLQEYLNRMVWLKGRTNHYRR